MKLKNPVGVEYTAKPLGKEEMEELCKLTLVEAALKKEGKPATGLIEEGAEFGFSAIGIIQKRIKALKLPIEFNDLALFATQSFVNNPGQAVALLVDCLNKFENKTVSVENLCELYPEGFYDSESFTNYVDNYLKPKTVKWSEIY